MTAVDFETGGELVEAAATPLNDSGSVGFGRWQVADDLSGTEERDISGVGASEGWDERCEKQGEQEQREVASVRLGWSAHVVLLAEEG